MLRNIVQILTTSLITYKKRIHIELGSAVLLYAGADNDQLRVLWLSDMVASAPVAAVDLDAGPCIESTLLEAMIDRADHIASRRSAAP